MVLLCSFDWSQLDGFQMSLHWPWWAAVKIEKKTSLNVLKFRLNQRAASRIEDALHSGKLACSWNLYVKLPAAKDAFWKVENGGHNGQGSFDSSQFESFGCLCTAMGCHSQRQSNLKRGLPWKVFEWTRADLLGLCWLGPVQMSTDFQA